MQAVAVMVEDAADVAAFANFTSADAGAAPAAPPTTNAPAPAAPAAAPAAPVAAPKRAAKSSMVSTTEQAVAPGPDSTMLTVRDALNGAMSEEMEADDRVYVMGEEVGEYQGAYKVRPSPAGPENLSAPQFLMPLGGQECPWPRKMSLSVWPESSVHQQETVVQESAAWGSDFRLADALSWVSALARMEAWKLLSRTACELRPAPRLPQLFCWWSVSS
jgi:hypothetical protein